MDSAAISGVTGEISPLARLHASLKGGVVLPTDPTYNQARAAWNLVIDQRPSLVVSPTSTAEVVEAVNYARHQGLKIAVQATGHGVIRKADDCLLILTAGLDQLEIDPQTQTARVGAGVKWGRVLAEAQAHGLAPLLGSSPDVSAVGYTLGGGMGWLARKYGLSLDSVVSLEVVTPDGVARAASPESEPDLFWAIRGGGGSFGVVTEMRIQLYPVSEVYAGNLFYPAELAPEVYARFADWVETLPDEMTCSIVLMNFPPLPVVPEPMRGKSFVIVRGCYAGPLVEGEALIRPWRDWRAPLMDTFHAMPFSQAADISQDPLDPMPAKATGVWLSDLSAETAGILIRHALPAGGPPVVTFSEVRLAGGAMARDGKHASPYSHRDARFIAEWIGFTPSPEAVEAFKQHTDQARRDLEAHLHGGVYMNFLEGDEAYARTHQGYHPESLRRLFAIKAAYDPDDMFCHSYDIRPQAG